MKFAPATFIFRQKDGTITGLLCAHVDDGVWVGYGKEFEATQNKLRATINIRKEARGVFTILGRRVTQTIGDKPSEDNIEVDQHEYLRGLKTVFIPAVRHRLKTTKLTSTELTTYQSVVQQLAWAARVTLPQLMYLVSELLQTK